MFISIVREITYFFRRYNDVIKQGEFFYAEGIGIHINWMIQCVYAFISVGIFSVIMAFSTHFPTWALFCYMISFIAVCIYIFNSYLNFMVIFSKLVDKETEAELIPRINTTPKSQLSPEVQQYIQAQIEEWIKAKGYCEDDVSLQSVSMKIYSNRQYLSSYINTTYQCSFRIWISKLRLEDAKEMLLNNPDMTITTIATKVGFQSLTSFTHAFTSIEGISPRKWAQTNRHHIKS
ncbi:MAG: AraC family transcriptional regulator [Rikenellaceae bacterium]